MHGTVLTLLIALASFALSREPVVAQAPGHGPAVLELPGGARALGLGYAFQADVPDSDGVFHSPALASRAQGFALGVHLLSNRARAFTVSAATPWFGGGVAVGLQALEYGTAHAPTARPGGLDPLLAGGGVGVSEMVASLAWGRDLFGLRVGLTGKLIDQRVGGDRRQDLAADLGVARSAGPGWAHVSVTNLGENGSLGGTEIPLPTGITLGWGAYGQPVGPLDLGGAAAVSRRADGEWTLGGGVEFGYWPVTGRTFVGRVGLRTVPEGDAWPLTLGGSFWGDDLILEYAFQGFEGRSGAHLVTLGWR